LYFEGKCEKFNKNPSKKPFFSGEVGLMSPTFKMYNFSKELWNSYLNASRNIEEIVRGKIFGASNETLKGLRIKEMLKR